MLWRAAWKAAFLVTFCYIKSYEGSWAENLCTLTDKALKGALQDSARKRKWVVIYMLLFGRGTSFDQQAEPLRICVCKRLFRNHTKSVHFLHAICPYAFMNFFLIASTFLFWGMYFGLSGWMKKAVTEWHSVNAGLCLTFASIMQLRSGPQVTELHISLAALPRGEGNEPFVRSIALDNALLSCQGLMWMQNTFCLSPIISLRLSATANSKISQAYFSRILMKTFWIFAHIHAREKLPLVLREISNIYLLSSFMHIRACERSEMVVLSFGMNTAELKCHSSRT